MNLNTGAVTPKIASGVNTNDDRALDAILNAIKVSHVQNLHEERLLMRRDSLVCSTLPVVVR
jgi:hypothetical protein